MLFFFFSCAAFILKSSNHFPLSVSLFKQSLGEAELHPELVTSLLQDTNQHPVSEIVQTKEVLDSNARLKGYHFTTVALQLCQLS